MKTERILLSYTRLSAVLLAVFAQSILTAMAAAVATFPTPFPVLSLLSTALQTLKDAMLLPPSKQTTADISAAKKEIWRILKPLAAYVEFICNNDQGKLLSSGFSLVKPRVPSPNVFAAAQGLQSGSVDVDSPAIGGAYGWQYTTDPLTANSVWLLAATTTVTSYTINGLTPGVKYWFRVVVITSAGDQPASDPIMVHVI